MTTTVYDTNDQTTLCDCLVHPFQNDPGMSQQRRVMEELLSGKAKIDARKMADLLDYIYQLSGNLNHYDNNLIVSDWRPFFEGSTPFVLASLIKYNSTAIRENYELYSSLFEKKPSSAGLQLIQYFIFYRIIKPLNNWYQQLRKTELPVERVFENIVRDKLRQPLLDFIAINRLAAKWFSIPPVNFTGFFENDTWTLPSSAALTGQMLKAEEKIPDETSCEKLVALYEKTKPLFNSLFDPIRILSKAAEQSMDQSLIPLKEEFQKKHLPQLGLLFAFLRLFQQLQADLNGFTKKHLDFFYKEVLKIKSKAAVPDKANMVFAIQKELDNYMLAKGLLLKDGKDLNKEEILFSLDDEIVVNQAQVKDTRTLFLNNQVIPDPAGMGGNIALLEGVYMAPGATKADGIEEDFQTEVKNFYTVGNKESKYLFPGAGIYKPYPNARLGFVLASPVLLLNEGTRTVTITLDCKLDENICSELAGMSYPPATRCCGTLPVSAAPGTTPSPVYPDFLSLSGLYTRVVDAINTPYYYISEAIIKDLIKKGISSGLIKKLRDRFLVSTNKTDDPEKEYCYCPKETKKYDAIISESEWADLHNDPDISGTEMMMLEDCLPARLPLKLSFSGEKAWIEPNKDNPVIFTVRPGAYAASFTLEIVAVLTPELDPVSFYNPETFAEDLGTAMPVAKIELDDKLKIYVNYSPAEAGCCLDKKLEFEDDQIPVSLYHFFRHVKVGPVTNIHVNVCGVKKNLVVQNDESLMDINGPVFPFGARPNIIDFSVIGASVCITQELIDDLPVAFSVKGKNFLQQIVNDANGQKTIAVNTIDTFLDLKDNAGNPQFTANDKNDLEARFDDGTKNYCHHNLVGPNFYIGSKEIFFKNWGHVWINLNWKEKPSNFNEYYKAYVLREFGATQFYGLNESEFEINMSVLDDGTWEREHNGLNARVTVNPKTTHFNRQLFKDDRTEHGGIVGTCVPGNPVQQVIELSADFFNTDKKFRKFEDIKQYKVDSLNGFIRITLENQDFLHKEYPFVLARQMMALGRLPDVALEGAVYIEHPSNNVITFKGSIVLLNQFFTSLQAIDTAAGTVRNEVKGIVDSLIEAIRPGGQGGPAVTAGELGDMINAITVIRNSNSAENLKNDLDGLILSMQVLQRFFSFFDLDGKILKPLEVPIPNEPFTPVLQGISLDYESTSDVRDIDLIHLYPFAGTNKTEEIQLEPCLFPTHCDEGSLFIGLEKLVPGTNVNILFQLAEATADSESDKEDVFWHYLDNNIWKPLRTGFEVLHDGTEDLTTSGIIQFALPENMTKTNSVMPKDLHWIKATIPKNSRSISETTGIHTQATSATFTNTPANDKLRLGKPIEAGQIAKLETADASVKQVIQPYETFGGRLPEDQGMFYVRVSELLRHKGRAIQKFDYERIVLDAFPEIFKAKCINHSFGLNAHLYKNDFPYAPGYIIMAVIPDLTKLKAGNAFEPKAPVSLLEKIDAHIRRRNSPFVRFRSMNPRYEKIHLCLKVKLQRGKNENYYKEKLKEDIRNFLAPWAIGKDLDKLRFGQCVNRSNIIGYLESLDYIDFILALNMRHESESAYIIKLDANGNPVETAQICPKTPRSILIAGDIDVCIDPKACEDWKAGTKCDNPAIKLIGCKTSNE